MHPGGMAMEKEEIKIDFKKIAKETEVKLTGILLKWKKQHDGNASPDMDEIERQSRIITEQANEILARRGKKVFEEIKGVYFKKDNGEDKKE
jgi:hypothetical protein